MFEFSAISLFVLTTNVKSRPVGIENAMTNNILVIKHIWPLNKILKRPFHKYIVIVIYCPNIIFSFLLLLG